jgi:hypothetical protein
MRVVAENVFEVEGGMSAAEAVNQFLDPVDGLKENDTPGDFPQFILDRFPCGKKAFYASTCSNCIIPISDINFSVPFSNG